jgi:hypothetical protein
MKLDTVVKELRKDNWFTGITFIEDYRDFLQALVDETEKQLSLPVVIVAKGTVCEHEWVKPIINAENKKCCKCGIWEEKAT